MPKYPPVFHMLLFGAPPGTGTLGFQQSLLPVWVRSTSGSMTDPMERLILARVAEEGSGWLEAVLARSRAEDSGQTVSEGRQERRRTQRKSRPPSRLSPSPPVRRVSRRGPTRGSPEAVAPTPGRSASAAPAGMWPSNSPPPRRAASVVARSVQGSKMAAARGEASAASAAWVASASQDSQQRGGAAWDPVAVGTPPPLWSTALEEVGWRVPQAASVAAQPGEKKMAALEARAALLPGREPLSLVGSEQGGGAVPLLWSAQAPAGDSQPCDVSAAALLPGPPPLVGRGELSGRNTAAPLPGPLPLDGRGEFSGRQAEAAALLDIPCTNEGALQVARGGCSGPGLDPREVGSRGRSGRSRRERPNTYLSESSSSGASYHQCRRRRFSSHRRSHGGDGRRRRRDYSRRRSPRSRSSSRSESQQFRKDGSLLGGSCSSSRSRPAEGRSGSPGRASSASTRHSVDRPQQAAPSLPPTQKSDGTKSVMFLLTGAIVWLLVASRCLQVHGKTYKMLYNPNVFDDQYIGCSDELEEKIMPMVLQKEISNSQFRDAWINATQRWYMVRDDLDLPQGFEDEHGISLLTFTNNYPAENPIHQQMNGNLTIAGASRKDYMEKFHFKALHFYLTRALQILKPNCDETYITYRGSRHSFQVRPVFKFGRFTSASIDLDAALDFGTESLFQIETCFGPKIDGLSFFPGEEEVLIPPTEKFLYVRKHNSYYILKSTRQVCSNFNCAYLKAEKQKDPICRSDMTQSMGESPPVMMSAVEIEDRISVLEDQVSQNHMIWDYYRSEVTNILQQFTESDNETTMFNAMKRLGSVIKDSNKMNLATTNQLKVLLSNEGKIIHLLTVHTQAITALGKRLQEQEAALQFIILVFFTLVVIYVSVLVYKKWMARP